MTKSIPQRIGIFLPVMVLVMLLGCVVPELQPTAKPTQRPVPAPILALTPTLTPVTILTPVPELNPTPSTGLGRLYWGVDSFTGQRWTIKALLARLEASGKDYVGHTTNRIIEKARETRWQEIPAVSQLNLEGTLANDPKYIASTKAVTPLASLYSWAFASMVMSDSEASLFRNKAVSTTQTWVDTYIPTGNPINENRLIPLLLAIDLEYDFFTPAQKVKVDTWLMHMASQSDTLFNKMGKNDTRLLNNWNSWRLALRGIASMILDDAGLRASSRELTAQHLRKNLLPDGSSYDFQQRDALHYHIYDMEALVWLDLFCPDLVSSEGRKAILKSLEFIRPYFIGEKLHVEFANSGVAFDATRREAGDSNFSLAAWEPGHARKLLRLASAHFPEIQNWTAAVEDEGYDPMIKHIAALHRKP